MEDSFGADCNLCRRRNHLRLSHRTRDQGRRASRRTAAPAGSIDSESLQRELQLKPEQADKIASILTQMENELSNLRSLDVRESDGIFARAKDRMDPIVAPDQRSRFQEILDEHRRRFEETSWIVERPH